MVDFPTPPLPDATATTWPTSDNSVGRAACAGACCFGGAAAGFGGTAAGFGGSARCAVRITDALLTPGWRVSTRSASRATDSMPPAPARSVRSVSCTSDPFVSKLSISPAATMS